MSDTAKAQQRGFRIGCLIGLVVLIVGLMMLHNQSVEPSGGGLYEMNHCFKDATGAHYCTHSTQGLFDK